jgi:transposase
MAVESTYNWYWLVDGLQDKGYQIDLANPAQIKQYSGIKHADDKNGSSTFLVGRREMTVC